MPAVASEAVSARRGAWHQSGLDSIVNGCARQWALANILDLPTPPKPSSEVGTAMHSAIEEHENYRLAGFPDGLPLAQMQDIAHRHLDNVIPDMVSWPMNKQTKVQAVAADLYAWSDQALEAWYSAAPKGGGPSNRDWLMDLEPVVVEPYFRTSLLPDTLPLAGWVDGLYRRKDTGGLVIVDEKSAGDFRYWKEGEHRLQATCYTVGILLGGYGAENLEDLEFWYLVNRTQVGKSATFERSRRLQVKPDLHDVQALGDLMRQAQGILEAERFPLNPAWGPLCSETWCPFWADCIGAPDGNGKYRQPWSRLKLTINPTNNKETTTS